MAEVAEPWFEPEVRKLQVYYPTSKGNFCNITEEIALIKQSPFSDIIAENEANMETSPVERSLVVSFELLSPAVPAARPAFEFLLDCLICMNYVSVTFK